ncbi:hypothetical protein [Streptomyces mexicanus]|uniref:hypothetical protein n=1 Tax=Streptomyces mexicanus TaxID=178566 RepID=UPI0036A05DED
MSELDSDHAKIAKIIELRMKEYESLRSEVVQRIGARQQMAGYAGAATAIAATLGSNLGYWRIVIVGLVLLVAYLFLRDSNDGIQRLGRHLRAIETDVNSLARTAYGREVLTWEASRQSERNSAKKLQKRIARVGGYHLEDPETDVPGPRGNSEPDSGDRTHHRGRDVVE